MAKRKVTVTTKATTRSTEEERLRAERERLRRKLALQRRVAQLSRQLEAQASRTQDRLFTLGRGLVTDRGWSVVDSTEADEAGNERFRLRARVAELEQQLEEARAAAGASVR